MKVIISIVFAFLFICGCKSAEDNSSFYMPGEFEEQEAVWLGWPGYDTFFPVSADMIEALLPFVQIKVITESDSLLNVCKNYLTKRNIDTTKIKFYVIPDNQFWIEDHGAAFTINKKGEMQAVDFGRNTYGIRSWMMEKYDNNSSKVDSMMNSMLESKREKVDSVMATQDSIPVIKSWIYIEGGTIEVNGKEL